MLEDLSKDTMLEMNWTEIQQYVDRKALVLLPLGVVEEHGPHLCLGTDIYTAHLHCLFIKEKIEAKGSAVIIAPPFYWGICQSTGSFMGSFRMRKGTVKAVLLDILTSLAEFGFKNVIGINAHGGIDHNVAILETFKEANETLSINSRYAFSQILLPHYGLTGDEGYLCPISSSAITVSTSAYPDVHAGDVETATMNRFYPRLTDIGQAEALSPVQLGEDKIWSWLLGGQTQQLSPLAHPVALPDRSEQHVHLPVYESGDNVARGIHTGGIMNAPIISQLGLQPDALAGETVIVTGAGGGIGYEAARALLWLGANVVIAEINEAKGNGAAEMLAGEIDARRVAFVRTDVGDEASVQNLYQEAVRRYGRVDAVINNATIAVLGTVKDLPIEKWDASYRVNLRGPVLMARAFLPDMICRKHGTFVCVSSTGTAYLGGYETFKAAQVHLGNTLDAELVGTGVIAFTIGPGLIPTETANAAVNRLAPLMGMTFEEFYALNKNAVLTPEEAGAGFAAAIVYAEQFTGMEISSLQALRAANSSYGAKEAGDAAATVNVERRQAAAALSGQVRATLKEQSDDWKRRSLFERQWVIRDFKKTAGMSADEWLDALSRVETSLRNDEAILRPHLEKLAGYYVHLAELAKGYEKGADKLQENLHHVYDWRDEVESLDRLLA